MDMTIGFLNLTPAVFLIGATALQLAVVVTAYVLGRGRWRAGWSRRSRSPDPHQEAVAPLDQAAERMGLVFRFAPDALLLCDPSGMVIEVNDYVTELTGYPREELVGRSLVDLAFISPEEQRRAATEFARLAGGQVSEMRPAEFTIRRKNGAFVPVEIRGELIPWQCGNSVLISARNISEHKRAQALIREQQARLTLVFEQMPAHVWTTDADLRIVSATGRGLAALGVTEADLVGRPLLEVMADSPILEQTRLVYAKALAGVTSPFVTTIAGNEIEGAIGPLRDDAGKIEGVIGVGLNITEQAQARRRLLENEALLEQAQSIAHLGAWEWDMVDGRAHWSGDLLRLVGVEPNAELPPDTPGEVLLEAYLSLVVEEDRETIRRGVTAAVQEDAPYVIEHRVRRPDGELRWLVTSGRVERDAQARPLRFHGFVQDITEQKTAEEAVRKLNAELEQRVADRTHQLKAAVEDLRSFSYAVAHDLRQPLRAISGFLTLLEEEAAAPVDEATHAHLARVKAAAHRMDELIGDLLALSRVTDAPLSRQRLDLSAMAMEVASEVAATDPSRKVEWVIEPGLVADADRGLARLVFENLFNNAWKFTRGRGDARIEFGAGPAVPAPTDAMSAARVAPAVFFVRDNGVGFDSSQASRLFQPFQRLHDPQEFEGSGIGLATVARIIRRHGGHIRAEGHRGGGATFRFSLSAAEALPPE